MNRLYNKVSIARLDLPEFDVSGIAKKLERQKWQNVFSMLSRANGYSAMIQDAELMKEFPEVLPILDTIHGEKNRVRFMRLRKEDGEIGRHADLVSKEVIGVEEGQQMRIHVPIITNSKVEFSVWNWKSEKENWYMRKGLSYYVDIRKPHAIVNRGDTDRVHLLVDVKSNKTLREFVFHEIN